MRKTCNPAVKRILRTTAAIAILAMIIGPFTLNAADHSTARTASKARKPLKVVMLAGSGGHSRDKAAL